MPEAGNEHRGGSLTVYDLDDEKSQTLALGPGRVAGEAVFAPADEHPGGPGWLLAFVHDAATDRSEVVVLDADAIEDGPVAAVRLPVRVPHGFHGSWLP